MLGLKTANNNNIVDRGVGFYANLGAGDGGIGSAKKRKTFPYPSSPSFRKTTPQANCIHAYISFFLLRYVLVKKMSQLEKTENRLATLKMSLLKSFQGNFNAD